MVGMWVVARYDFEFDRFEFYTGDPGHHDLMSEPSASRFYATLFPCPNEATALANKEWFAVPFHMAARLESIGRPVIERKKFYAR